MATIALKGMEFYAHHGYYPEERVIGNAYSVDVWITTSTQRAAVTDELSDTINYETVFLIVEAEMRKPSHLLEQVIQRIVMALKHQFANIQAVKVRLTKQNPPLGGQVQSAILEEDLSYVANCGRCKKPLICYGDETCWCHAASVIHPKTLENLRHQFGGKCLCKECLTFFAG